MCFLCDEYQSGEIDGQEALETINEAITVELEVEHKANLMKHMLEMSDMILAKEVPMTEKDEALDKQWSKETYGDNNE